MPQYIDRFTAEGISGTVFLELEGFQTLISPAAFHLCVWQLMSCGM
jgi:hypothetical protein